MNSINEEEYIVSTSCNFCGKSDDEVSKMITGPNVYICNECVMICCEIMDYKNEELKLKRSQLMEKITKKEIEFCVLEKELRCLRAELETIRIKDE